MKNLRRTALLAAIAILPLAAGARQAAPERQAAQPAQPQEAPVDARADDPTDVLGFTMTDIRGEPRPLGEYRGKVVLMVNVASECGLTPQYEDLQGLHEKYGEQGLVVLGFPANDFKGQEPGTDEEILQFCTREYKVSFPMFSKISVIGEDRHPLYAKLAAAMSEQGGEPTWNFTKYLVDRTGHVVKRIEPKTEPADPEVIAEIERLLAKPVPSETAPG